jgi:hypothetical protein
MTLFAGALAAILAGAFAAIFAGALAAIFAGAFAAIFAGAFAAILAGALAAIFAGALAATLLTELPTDNGAVAMMAFFTTARLAINDLFSILFLLLGESLEFLDPRTCLSLVQPICQTSAVVKNG